jgi:hypothetical protein
MTESFREEANRRAALCKDNRSLERLPSSYYYAPTAISTPAVSALASSSTSSTSAATAANYYPPRRLSPARLFSPDPSSVTQTPSTSDTMVVSSSGGPVQHHRESLMVNDLSLSLISFDDDLLYSQQQQQQQQQLQPTSSSSSSRSRQSRYSKSPGRFRILDDEDELTLRTLSLSAANTPNNNNNNNRNLLSSFLLTSGPDHSENDDHKNMSLHNQNQNLYSPCRSPTSKVLDASTSTSAFASSPAPNNTTPAATSATGVLCFAQSPLENTTTKAARLAEKDYQHNGDRAKRGAEGGFVPPRWIPDEEALHCRRCGAAFDELNDWLSLALSTAQLAMRRHHCRYCGQVVCDRCSPSRLLLPAEYGVNEPQRVCISCAEVLYPLQSALSATIANHMQSNAIDIDTDHCNVKRYLNAPYASSLNTEIRKAAYALHNMLSLQLIRDKVR